MPAKVYQVSRVLVFGDGTVHRVPIRTFEEEEDAGAFSKLSQGALERLVLSTLIDDAVNAVQTKPSTADRLVASLGIKQIHTVVLPVEVEGTKEPSLIQVPRLVSPRH